MRSNLDECLLPSLNIIYQRLVKYPMKYPNLLIKFISHLLVLLPSDAIY